MNTFYLITFLLGLLLGVRAMLVGIVRSQEELKRAPLLNLPTIGGFLAVMGATGYLLDRYSTLSPVVVLIIGLVLGAAAAAGTISLIAGWAVPSAVRDPEDPRFELQGHPGIVVRPIESGDVGQIQFDYDNRRHLLPARSVSGEPIGAGAEIVIERVEDGVAHIELWSVIEKEIESHH